MTLQQLINRFRRETDDRAEPYFWSDGDITDWLNDAEHEAAIRGRLLHEAADPAICRISVTPGQAIYPLHISLYELTHLELLLDGQQRPKRLALVSREWLDARLSEWRRRKGRPEYAVQDDRALRLVPEPLEAGTLILEGYRLPLQPLAEDADTPEIHAAHHVHLLQWAYHKAFSVPDAESFDPQRATQAEAAFDRYFGLRPDADLRRTTREDVPQHVEAFWP